MSDTTCNSGVVSTMFFREYCMPNTVGSFAFAAASFKEKLLDRLMIKLDQFYQNLNLFFSSRH